jgi:cell division protein FtsB
MSNQQKIKRYTHEAYRFVLRFQDIRFAGQMLFVVIVLLISWSGVKAIETNYQLQRQISALRQQTDIQKLKNMNLTLQNGYFNTNQYLELSTRQNFGLAAPGEKELIVSKEVALAHTVPITHASATQKLTTRHSRFEQNYKAWLDFFMNQQQAD